MRGNKKYYMADLHSANRSAPDESDDGPAVHAVSLYTLGGRPIRVTLIRLRDPRLHMNFEQRAIRQYNERDPFRKT
jgi:hypothetical protein